MEQIFLLKNKNEAFQNLANIGWATTMETNSKRDVLFIIGYWNASVGSQEIPGVTGRFGLGVQNEAGQRLTVLTRGSIDDSKHPLPITQEMTLKMDITRWSKLKLKHFNSIIF